MQSRLPKIRRNSLDRSTDRPRTRSRAGYQLHPQQLSSHLASTAGERNHSHTLAHLGDSLPGQKRDIIISLVDFQYNKYFRKVFKRKINTVRSYSRCTCLPKGKREFEKQWEQWWFSIAFVIFTLLILSKLYVPPYKQCKVYSLWPSIFSSEKLKLFVPCNLGSSCFASPHQGSFWKSTDRGAGCCGVLGPEVSGEHTSLRGEAPKPETDASAYKENNLLI